MAFPGCWAIILDAILLTFGCLCNGGKPRSFFCMLPGLQDLPFWEQYTSAVQSLCLKFNELPLFLLFRSSLELIGLLVLGVSL